ncbi:uncharacterized protein LOC129769078 [Toxorhynchites rutilus septentrionalis]|uniref:uncharacterized protein LOC129769078 n=1 Tax=Toxorhynchites rutilus septentrionalis TaxID=329112 RepID=UPI00247ADEAF|nr:uncharacterized protein LOC129769078 [Toxorhynchites rutilus septentrionalis]
MNLFAARFRVVLLLSLLVVTVSCYWNNGVESNEKSYFFGSRAVTDVLCFKRTLSRGSLSPTRVGYKTTTTNKNITMVTVNAEREYPYGYNVLLESGALDTNEVNFKFIGKNPLPYNVLFDFWCTP